MVAVLGEPLLVDDPMLTAAQGAALLGVNQSTVNRMTRRGLLPVRGRGRRRFRLSDLNRVEIPPRRSTPGGRGAVGGAGGSCHVAGGGADRRDAGDDAAHQLPGHPGAAAAEQRAARGPPRADAEELARRLLRDRVLRRHPDWDRPILAHHVQQLLDSGWAPPTDPVHQGGRRPSRPRGSSACRETA